MFGYGREAAEPPLGQEMRMKMSRVVSLEECETCEALSREELELAHLCPSESLKTGHLERARELARLAAVGRAKLDKRPQSY